MDLNEQYKKIDALNLSKYTLIKKEILEDLNSVGLLLKHKKSGARVVVITNEDENKVFSIGFKTPPYNDTGLQHILEHSTLCGSRKYPVKDPFVELCKGSLNTFLNAMTYPDKTVYPVASCNDADFKNIMDVYMDAVFYPNIYTRPQIFKQEGWHYELESEDAPLTYNGVVFNEMKGVYSSPDDILSRDTFVSLFPHTAYRFESGGDPEKIPSLSYEEFLKYHKTYYHPVNSYIYLYGNMDVQERLDYLDNEYLAAFDQEEVSIDTKIGLEQPFAQMTEEIHEYAVTEDEPLEHNAFLSMNKVVSTSLDQKTYLAMQILDYALIMAPGAKLKQALIDAGIGTDIYSNYESSVYQPVYSIIAKNADASQKDAFVQTITKTLEDIVANGIDQRMIAAGINYFEFKYREADYGPYPKGLMYYLTMMDSWLYDENEPFMHIEAGKTFELIKKEAKEGLFEDLIQKYLLTNQHGSIISLVPSRTLEEEKDTKEQDQLEQFKASMSGNELTQLVKDTIELKEYQDEPSPQKELEKIPMLALSDIEKEAQKLYNDKKEIAGVDVIHHNMFTNKIAYLVLSFDCRDVSDELMPYIGLLSSTLGLMDTENFTYPELTNEININCGGISTEASIYSDSKDFSKYRMMYEVKGKVLYEKIDFVLHMMQEIIFRTKFDDYKRLKEIIARIKSRLESSMTSSGHTVAMLSCMAEFSETAYYSNQMRGYGFYRLIYELDKHFDEQKEAIVANLEQLVQRIFTKDHLIVSCCADDTGYKTFETPMEKFVADLKNSAYTPAKRTFTPVNVKTAFTSSSQVHYVARCGNYERNGYHYTGALKVLKVIFSYEYLWINVRVKGGAYGCMSGFSKNGDTYMVSYRDPNLKKTNDIYLGAADYIKDFSVSERDMVKFIIGTIGDMDTPLNPSAKGLRSFGAYLCNTTYEDMQRERDEVLGANEASIRALAPMIETAMNQGYLCVVGNQKTINDDKNMFEKIEPLFIS
jgi:Zn-dependent M16 (insulinase) family peptidase